MSTVKHSVGDVVKYTYQPGKPEEGWFLARIAEIRDSGYIVNLVDKGENTPYQSNTFNGIHLGEDSANIEAYTLPPVRLGGTTIGVVPEVKAPKYTAPFRADADRVLDSKNDRVTWVDSDSTGHHDDSIAQVIAKALNEYYGV